VIAITSGLGDMQAVLNLVWDKLVPAMQPRRLAANASGDQQLTDKLAHLSVRLPAGAATSPKSAEILGRKFVVPANEQKLEALALEASPGGGFTLVRWIGGVPQRIVCGEGRWIRGRASVAAALSPQAIAAAGAWTAPDTFTAKLCLYETPYAITVTLKFAGNDVVHDAASNVGFGPTRQSQLVGHAE